jgi:hypothetical protein
MVRRRSTVRFRKGALRGLHVSSVSIFTFGSDILAWLVGAGWGCWSRAGRTGCRAFPGPVRAWCACAGSPWGAGERVAAGRSCGAAVLSGQGGAAARLARVVRRRRFLVLGGSPAAARRALSAWRLVNASRMRWLRTTSAQASHRWSGVRPVRRHQPRLMLLLAVSLIVAKVRSAPVRRAWERRCSGEG